MQKVKGGEVGRTAAEKQFIELRMALIVYADNLAVQNGVLNLQEQLNARAEVGKASEAIAFL